MIPKQIAFFWSGNNLSWLRYLTLYSFRKLNPDWEIILYLYPNTYSDNTPSKKSQDFVQYTGKNYLPDVSMLDINVITINLCHSFQNLEPAFKCDIIEWKTLYRYGGYFSDMDILFIKPLNNLYNKLQDYDVILSYRKYFSIGFMGGISNCKFYRDLFNQCSLTNVDKKNYQIFGVCLFYKYLREYLDNIKEPNWLQAIHSKYPELNIHNLRWDIFYYFSYREIERLFNKICGIPENVLGIHWFGGAELSQVYNNLLTPENYKSYPSTMIKHIEEIWE